MQLIFNTRTNALYTLKAIATLQCHILKGIWETGGSLSALHLSLFHLGNLFVQLYYFVSNYEALWYSRSAKLEKAEIVRF